MKIDKKDLLIYSAFAFITLIFFYPFLDGSNIFGFKDLSRYFYPLRQLMVDQVKSGVLPLWNPYLFCGYPFLASLQIGFFYPLSLIYYILPFHLAFNYYTIIHYFLASIFTYLLMRHYRVSRPAAFLSGLVFAYSGYLVSVANMNTTLSSVIWVPLALLFFDRMAHGSEFRVQGSGLIICLALMFLGGEPTIIYMTVFILLSYGICFAQHKRQCALALIISLFLAFLLCAIQLLPFLELASLSDRTVLTDIKTVAAWSMPIRETINFILPYFFGNSLKPGSYNEAFLGKETQDWLISPYLGFVPLFFAFFALIRGDRKVKFWGGALFIGLLLCYGRYTPFYLFFYKLLPGAAMIRYPVKFIFIPVFSAALLSGFGFDRYFEKERKKTAYHLFSSAGAIFSLYLLLILYKDQIFKFFSAGISPEANEVFFQAVKSNFDFSLRSIANLAAVIFLFGLVLFLYNRKTLSYKTSVFIIAGIIILDLSAVNFSINIPVNRRILLKAAPNIEFLLKDKTLFRYCLTNKLTLHNRSIYGANYNQAILEAKDKFAANRPLTHKLYDFDGYESIVLDSHNQMEKQLSLYSLDKHLKELGDFNVKYIISLYPLDSKQLKIVQNNSTYYCGETYIYQNEYFKPRAYLNVPGRADIIEYKPDKVVVSIDSKSRGELFLSDTYYPGWKAYLDGREGEIKKTSLKFRSIGILPGKQRVVFSYEPLSFKIGAAVSLMAMLGIAFLAIYIKRRGCE